MMDTTNSTLTSANPFIPIDKKWRVFLMLFLILYFFISPIISELVINSGPLAFLRLLVNLIVNLLLFAPLFFYRSNWGWLHPLIFPLIFTMLKNFIKEPSRLFPLTGGDVLFHSALSELTEYEMAIVYLKADFLVIISLVFFYLGFFIKNRITIPTLGFYSLQGFNFKISVFIFSSFALFVYFVNNFGGLNNLFLAFSGLRFETLGGTGHVRAVISGLSFSATLIWYAYRPSAIRNPYFILCFLFTVVVGFLISGSRSSIFYTLVMFLVIWMVRNQKVPAGKAIIISLVGFLSLGVLGEIRNAGRNTDTIDWTLLLDKSLEERILSTTDHLEQRKNSYEVVVAKGIQEEGLLLGRTYLGGVFFWVPRAIWKSKPRGAGAYAGSLLFGRGTLEGNSSGGKGASRPPGGVGEAYWNFHIPGVMIVYLLFGISLRWLARLLIKYSFAPAIWVIYTVALFEMDTQTVSMVSFFQTIVPIILLLYWLKGIRLIKG